jgi:hypothetical protein
MKTLEASRTGGHGKNLLCTSALDSKKCKEILYFFILMNAQVFAHLVICQVDVEEETKCLSASSLLIT